MSNFDKDGLARSQHGPRKRTYVPICVVASCPVCKDSTILDGVPLLDARDGKNEFHVVCENGDCSNYSRVVIRTAIIHLRTTVEAKVTYKTLRHLVHSTRMVGDRIHLNEGEWYDGNWNIVEILDDEAPEGFVLVQMKREEVT